ncbi:uncharacterized protein LOC117188773 isoform X2 [Drosophila miranda]|nr:uncharacterized protein LOC117188773 isoform X2 [Drosophila miranda]
MGNSGSSHQLNIQRQNTDPSPHAKNLSQQFRQSSHRHYDYSKPDIRSSPTPQKGYSQQWRRSFPTSNSQKVIKYKTDENVQFKVLPRIDKSLHLRATTNGAILNSGGTISGRRLSENPISCPTNAPMQRSRTFIVESTNNSLQTEFTRSQTLHHVKANYKKDNLVSNKKSNLTQMQRHTYSEPELVNKNNKETATNQSLARSEKKNKYTKKRRAPEVPTESINIVPAVHPETAEKDISTSMRITNEQGRQTHFSKNTDRLTTVNKGSNLSFKRKSAERNSVGGNCRPNVPINQSKLAYRREKSSDAIIIRSKNAKEVNVNTESTGEKKTHYKHNNHSIKESPMNSAPNKKDTKNISAPTPEAQKHRRTFYFGMDVNTITETRQDSQDNKVMQPIYGLQPDSTGKNIVSIPTAHNTEKNLNSNEGTSLLFVPNYDIEYKKSTSQEDSVDDNGLRLCIRPTLPRRQLDTPSFSPALAWRTLLDDDVQIDREINISDPNGYQKTEKNELPIQPSIIYEIRHVRKINKLQNAWTPEQDLCDQIDDTAGNLATDSDSSSDDYRSKCEGEALLFYGSKSKISSHNSVSPLHTFSLSLPRDGHLQHARKLDNLKSNDVCIYKSLRKRKPEFFFSKRPGSQASISNIPTAGTTTKIDGFENWMLHKNVGKNGVCLNRIKDTDNSQELPVIEQQSLKTLAGGKHVMYLPGNNDKPACNSSRGELETCKTKPSRHFKSRQRHVPENLQDRTPIYPITSATETNVKLADRFHQRFTFHNPVRLLEKLYSDRSTKDVDTENIHRSEVEALKRVEEDFQRNRANEKESIRHQLQLHFGLESKNKGLYNSLPNPSMLDSFSSIDINDSNNNTFCRDDPEGCASNAFPVGPEGNTC